MASLYFYDECTQQVYCSSRTDGKRQSIKIFKRNMRIDKPCGYCTESSRKQRRKQCSERVYFYACIFLIQNSGKHKYYKIAQKSRYCSTGNVYFRNCYKYKVSCKFYSNSGKHEFYRNIRPACCLKTAEYRK